MKPKKVLYIEGNVTEADIQHLIKLGFMVVIVCS